METKIQESKTSDQVRIFRKVGEANLFGDLNDCYGRALQQELAEANRLEQKLIEAGNRYYAEMIEEEMIEEEKNCGKE